jgi:hypothetical protein
LFLGFSGADSPALATHDAGAYNFLIDIGCKVFCKANCELIDALGGF